MPRCGTTSLSSIFSSYGSKSEFMEAETIQSISSFNRKNISLHDLSVFLRTRWSYDMMIDAASFNFLIKDILLDIFPTMQYICLVRQCDLWINSFVKMLVYYYKYVFKLNTPPLWMNDYGLIYSPYFNWDTLYKISTGTISSDGYRLIDSLVDFWIYHTDSILKFAIATNSLVLNTANISSSIHLLQQYTHLALDHGQIDSYVNKARIPGMILPSSLLFHINKKANILLPS